MAQRSRVPNRSVKTKTKPPQTDNTLKQKPRQKAEEQEVAGRHKNDGQKPMKGRR